MGKFSAIGMRTKVEDASALVVNSCSDNDSSLPGSETRWSWCNPTNRVIPIHYEDIVAVSVESCWQGCKLLPGQTRPDDDILQGNWRKNKGKRPAGAYAGPNAPLITTPGEARRRIYIPSYRNLVTYWLQASKDVRKWVEEARNWSGPVFIRDHDTGRGIDRNGPMSHSWVLCMFLNNNQWPG